MKKFVLATAVVLLSSASYGGWTSDDEILSLGADAELNFDVIKNKHGINANNLRDLSKRTATCGQINDDSRVKLTLMWQEDLEGGYFVRGKAQPMFRTDNTYYSDDIYFMLGRNDSWRFQIGRYEAMNLFPMGMDVAVFYAAGSDGIGNGVYYYMTKEARGRSYDAGQARIVGEWKNWTAEVSTIYGNTAQILTSTNIYLNDVPLDRNVTSKNNSVMARPAVNYKSDSGFVSVSFGGEYEFNKDSVQISQEVNSTSTSGITTTNTINLDLSDRYGLGATASLNFSDLLWNNSVAMGKAKHLWTIYTVNSNVVYKERFGLGVSATKNNFKSRPENARSYVIYTAYSLPLFGMDNAKVRFALSYSDTKSAFGVKHADETTSVFRTSFVYAF